MLLDNVMKCDDLSVNLSVEENNENLIESVVHVHKFELQGGPQQTHMLYTSYKLWQDMLASNVPLTVFIVFQNENYYFFEPFQM